MPVYNSGYTETSRELAIYATNHSGLYRQQIQQIIKNLARKIVKGSYDPKLALVLWGYAAANASALYINEWPGSTFSKSDRELAAQEMAEYYDDQLQETAQQMRDGVINLRGNKPKTTRKAA